MTNSASEGPDLARLEGVVAPEILTAAAVASAKLREAEIPHALVGGLAVGAYGYPRTTDDVDFLVGDEAFEKHAEGLVTLRMPVVAVGNVRVDLVPMEESSQERKQLRSALASARESQQIPVVPLDALLYMKLKTGRQKDIADVVELLKRGRIDRDAIRRYLNLHAPALVQKWEKTLAAAALEE